MSFGTGGVASSLMQMFGGQKKPADASQPAAPSLLPAMQAQAPALNAPAGSVMPVPSAATADNPAPLMSNAPVEEGSALSPQKKLAKQFMQSRPAADTSYASDAAGMRIGPSRMLDSVVSGNGFSGGN